MVLLQSPLMQKFFMAILKILHDKYRHLKMGKKSLARFNNFSSYDTVINSYIRSYKSST